MPYAQAKALLPEPLILGAFRKPVGTISAEHQVMSLTSNLNAGGTAPTSPGQYWNWFTGGSRCPNCSTMPFSDWRIGIADTGLDNGQSTAGRAALSGRKIIGGLLSVNPNCPPANPQCECSTSFPGCDNNGHGTMVAGVAAGAAMHPEPSPGARISPRHRRRAARRDLHDQGLGCRGDRFHEDSSWETSTESRAMSRTSRSWPSTPIG
jgi:hypothetical protein